MRKKCIGNKALNNLKLWSLSKANFLVSFLSLNMQTTLEVEDSDGPEDRTVKRHWRSYLLKLQAKEIDPGDPFPMRTKPYPYPEPWQNFVSCWFACFCGIAILAYLTYNIHQVPLILGSFGASSVLYFAAPNSPLAQPRNALLGQFLSAFIGFTIRNIITAPELRWLAAALAVSTATTLMIACRILHPPGGATALIAASLEELPIWSGYFFVLCPVLVGNSILFLLALLLNNLGRYRHYPDLW
jgi:CBS-domain-containing membrane protein